MENLPADILIKDVHELGVSRSLAHLFEINHLECLKDLLASPMEEWFAIPGFNQHLLNELMNYLANYQLLPEIKE